MGLMDSILGKKEKKKDDKKKPADRKDVVVDDESTLDSVARDLTKELQKDSIVKSGKRKDKK